MPCYTNQNYGALQNECNETRNFTNGFLTGIMIAISVLGIRYIFKKK